MNQTELDNTLNSKWYKFGETIGELTNNIHIRRTILGCGLVGGLILSVWIYVNMYWLFAVFLVVICVYAVGAAAEAMLG